MLITINNKQILLNKCVYYAADFELFNQLLTETSKIYKKHVLLIKTSDSKKWFNKKNKFKYNFIYSKSLDFTKKIIFVLDDSELFSTKEYLECFHNEFGTPIILFSKNNDVVYDSYIANLNEAFVGQKEKIKNRSLKFELASAKNPQFKIFKRKTIFLFIVTMVLGIFASSLFYGYGALNVETQIDSTYQYIGKMSYNSDQQYSHCEYVKKDSLEILGDNGANAIMSKAYGYNSFTPYYYVSYSEFRDTKYVPLYIEAFARDFSDITITFANGKTKDIKLISSGTDLGYCAFNSEPDSILYNVFNKIALKRVFHIENDYLDNDRKSLFLPTWVLEDVMEEGETLENYIANPDQHVTLKIGEYEFDYSIANFLVDDYGHTPILKSFFGDFAYLNLSYISNYLYAKIYFDPSSSYINTQSLLESSIIPYFSDGDQFIGYRLLDGALEEVREFTLLSDLYTKQLFYPSDNLSGKIALMTFAIIFSIASFVLIFYAIYPLYKGTKLYVFLLIAALFVFAPYALVSLTIHITQSILLYSMSSFLLVNSFGGLASFATAIITFLLLITIVPIVGWFKDNKIKGAERNESNA